MKEPRVYNYGVLSWKPEILEAYALYLLRFVQAYHANPFREQVEVVIAVAGERYALRLDAYSLNTVIFES